MKEFYVELVYNDDSINHFYVKVEGAEHEYMALISMITRGTLMASSAKSATCYNDEGFDVCSYVK